MTRVLFDQLPPDARLWIFAAARPLAATERDRVLAAVDAFLDGWTAHGVALRAARDVRDDRFLLVAVDEAAAGASGCSIDSLFRELRALQRELGVTLVDTPPVWFRDGREIAVASRARFAKLAAAGVVGRDTPVFDNTLSRVGELREGRWERRAGDAWHAKVFFDD